MPSRLPIRKEIQFEAKKGSDGSQKRSNEKSSIHSFLPPGIRKSCLSNPKTLLLLKRPHRFENFRCLTHAPLHRDLCFFGFLLCIFWFLKDARGFVEPRHQLVLCSGAPFWLHLPASLFDLFVFNSSLDARGPDSSRTGVLQEVRSTAQGWCWQAPDQGRTQGLFSFYSF